MRRVLHEKYGNPYIPLACGHYTDADTDRLFRVLAPLLPSGKRAAKHYCETCGKWQRRQSMPRRKPVPQEPLF